MYSAIGLCINLLGRNCYNSRKVPHLLWTPSAPCFHTTNIETLPEDWIVHCDATVFYVDNQDVFDNTVRSVLRELVEPYANVTYAVVLAYLPPERKDNLVQYQNYTYTIPEDIVNIPKRFAID